MGQAAAIDTIATIVHVLAAVVWVGGMFFALVVLRPSSSALDSGPRLELWARVLGRFFAWVLGAIVLLLASGSALVFSVFGDFAAIGLYVQLMMGLGIVMMLLFFHVYFAPFRRFRLAVARRDLATAGRQLNQIRWFVTVGLTLGLITVAIGASGRYWG
jgi:uncharacterized membrane protein